MKSELKKYLESTDRARDFALRKALTDRQLEILLRMHAENMGPMDSIRVEPEEYGRRMNLALNHLTRDQTHLAKDVKYLFKETDLISKVINPYHSKQVVLALTPSGIRLCQEAEDYILQREYSQKI